MDKKIICPICDEELGSSVEAMPEKCPICDTRKYEILQELKEQNELKNAQEKATVVVPENPVASNPVVAQAASAQRQVIVEEEIPAAEGIIFEDHAPAATDTAAIVRAELPVSQAAPAEMTPVVKSREDDVVFSEPSGTDVVFDEQTAASKPESAPQAIAIAQPAPVPMTKKNPLGKYRRTGASTLETFPIGCKFCPACGEGFAKDFEPEKCPYCPQHAVLQSRADGFPPGHYLVLYNHNRKAIGYFRLDHAGSVIIGRSSERNSPHDIDLTSAWHAYYEKNSQGEDDFKDKMRLLKGISSKHALIRYLQAEKKYGLFHLSDKNFTVITLPSGEKRERSANNRTLVEMVPNSLVAMGDQQNFIILRYKVLTLKETA